MPLLRQSQLQVGDGSDAFGRADDCLSVEYTTHPSSYSVCELREFRNFGTAYHPEWIRKSQKRPICVVDDAWGMMTMLMGLADIIYLLDVGVLVYRDEHDDETFAIREAVRVGDPYRFSSGDGVS